MAHARPISPSEPNQNRAIACDQSNSKMLLPPLPCAGAFFLAFSPLIWLRKSPSSVARLLDVGDPQC